MRAYIVFLTKLIRSSIFASFSLVSALIIPRWIASKFHINNLRKFQSLPIRTPTAVIYLLIGAMPIDAEIHQTTAKLPTQHIEL
jgi:hypothetical protein